MRPDGVRVKAENPLYNLLPYVIPKRYDSMNMVTLDIPEAPLRAYMNEKRKENRSVSHLAIFLTAYLRMVEKYPALNRFIGGNHKIYEHKEISAGMVVLRPGGGETMIKLILDPGDTIFDVQNKINEMLETNRQAGNDEGVQGETNGLDKIVNFLLRSGPLLDFLMALLRFASSRGLLPKKITDASPFHSSLLISNLASIRCNHIYHHIYDFGTISVAMTLGNMREVPKRLRDGGIDLVRCIPVGVVMDERLENGNYYNSAFLYMKRYLSDPRLLESGE
ncbi:MAG: hypothetical protein MJ074_06895 [Oscillospiraceae bacterium]|nr:hypothetical protein [Oscillospiraceae bacterium]